MPKKKRHPRKPARRREPQPSRTGGSAPPALGSNVISYALSQGVDVTDPAALDAFMAYYNGLPRHMRVAISDGDWHDEIGGDEVEELDVGWPDTDEWPSGDEAGGGFPDLFGELPDDATLEAHVAGVDEDAYYAGSTLMRRADLVLRHIGDGHSFTNEEGLGRGATVALLEQFGYQAEEVETMWDAPPLSALVAGLAGGGYLEVSAGVARPAALVSPWAWPDAPAEERTGAGRVLYATTLSAFLEETEEGSAALVPPFTAMALLAACGPDGVNLPETATDTDEYGALRQNVRADLLALEDLGIVRRDGDVFTTSPVLLTVLPAVLETVSGELPE